MSVNRPTQAWLTSSDLRFDSRWALSNSAPTTWRFQYSFWSPFVRSNPLLRIKTSTPVLTDSKTRCRRRRATRGKTGRGFRRSKPRPARPVRLSRPRGTGPRTPWVQGSGRGRHSCQGLEWKAARQKASRGIDTRPELADLPGLGIPPTSLPLLKPDQGIRPAGVFGFGIVFWCHSGPRIPPKPEVVKLSISP